MRETNRTLLCARMCVCMCVLVLVCCVRFDFSARHYPHSCRPSYIYGFITKHTHTHEPIQMNLHFTCSITYGVRMCVSVCKLTECATISIKVVAYF